MGTKLIPGEYDCYRNALPDEPMFILLARDPMAPKLVEDWAADRMRAVMMRMRPLEDLKMVDEAQRCAKAMREWRAANDGKWRPQDPNENEDCRTTESGVVAPAQKVS